MGEFTNRPSRQNLDLKWRFGGRRAAGCARAGLVEVLLDELDDSEVVDLFMKAVASSPSPPPPGAEESVRPKLPLPSDAVKFPADVHDAVGFMHVFQQTARASAAGLGRGPDPLQTLEAVRQQRLACFNQMRRFQRAAGGRKPPVQIARVRWPGECAHRECRCRCRRT